MIHVMTTIQLRKLNKRLAKRKSKENVLILWCTKKGVFGIHQGNVINFGKTPLGYCIVYSPVMNHFKLLKLNDTHKYYFQGCTYLVGSTGHFRESFVIETNIPCEEFTIKRGRKIHGSGIMIDAKKLRTGSL